MEKAKKIHLFYWLIIILVIIISNYKNLLIHYMNLNKDGYIRINTDVELINPKNGERIGYLKKGVVFKYPHLEDLKDCSLTDNQRYKLLFDIEKIEKKHKKSILGTDEAFDPQNSSVYNSVIILEQVNVDDKPS